jgi:hypothetical protein
VFLAAGALFFTPYWLIVFGLRRLVHDAPVYHVASPPFNEPAEWTSILNGIPNLSALSPHDRQRLGRLIEVFLRHVQFEGAQGLTITTEMRVTIAAQACLLVLNHPRGALGRLRTIVVYPTTFLPRRFSWHGPDQAVAATPTLGESWHRGTVVLAWDTVLEGVSKPTDGHNVAVHEFAHQLDSLSGDANGIPPLGNSHRYHVWARVLEESFARFARDVRKGRAGALDAYGATNPAEFFAVATENFFERPRDLQHQFPALYNQLQQYYRQDPVAPVLPPRDTATPGVSSTR